MDQTALALLWQIPLGVMFLMFIARRFVLGRSILNCGMWEDLWAVIWGINLTCLMQGQELYSSGVGGKVFDKFSIPSSLQSFLICLCIMVLLKTTVFVYCLWKAKLNEEAENLKRGYGVSGGHAVPAFFRYVALHAITIAFFVFEIETLSLTG
jgi:hypothetical protein